MPIFSKTVPTAQVARTDDALIATREPIVYLVDGRPLAMRIFADETEMVPDNNNTNHEFPLAVCPGHCLPANFRRLNSFYGKNAARTKNPEIMGASCSQTTGRCNFRIPGSAEHLIREAHSKGRVYLKAALCPLHLRPMQYFCQNSETKNYEIRCSYSRCQCIPIPIGRGLLDEASCTPMTDDLWKHCVEHGFSRLTCPISASSLASIDAFAAEVISADFLAPAFETPATEPKPKIAAAPKPKKAPTKRAAASEKPVTVKAATMRKATRPEKPAASVKKVAIVKPTVAGKPAKKPAQAPATWSPEHDEEEDVVIVEEDEEDAAAELVDDEAESVDEEEDE